MSLILSLSVLLIDQLSKYVILRTLPYGEVHVMAPFFNIIHARNTGISFSLMSSLDMRWGLVFLTTCITAYVMKLWWQADDAHHRIAYGAIVGGALGNMIDRTIHGSVVDFLLFHLGSYSYPAFNVADMAIVCGVGWLLLRSYARGS